MLSCQQHTTIVSSFKKRSVNRCHSITIVIMTSLWLTIRSHHINTSLAVARSQSSRNVVAAFTWQTFAAGACSDQCTSPTG